MNYYTTTQKLYYTTTGGNVNLSIDDVITHETLYQARTFHEFGNFEIRTMHPLDKHEWGSSFTLTVYNHNGAHVHTFNVSIDSDDGSWQCEDVLYYGAGVFPEIVEQAACDFNEFGKQTGIYEVVDFECDCDADGSQFAWIISAV